MAAPIIEYPFETTRTASSLIRSETIDRYPGIRFILAHGGGTIPYLYRALQSVLALNQQQNSDGSTMS